MRRRRLFRRLSAGALLLAAAGGLALFALLARDGRPASPQTPPEARASQPALFYDQVTFFDAVRATERAAPLEGPVVGGIIPHHWLAGRLITQLFHALAAGDAPRTIVLIGPNHPNAGSARALTSVLPWETPFGLVEPDEELIRALTATGLVQIEDAVLTTEHSVAGIMPAIKYYLPQTQVVPLILSGEMAPAEARRLGQTLAGEWTDGVVFVAAVDFSHYLVRREAERHDAMTLEALRAFDAATLFTFDNGYLDSPPSIAVLIEVMSALGADQFVLLENTNSGALRHDELAPTTSYFAGYYRRTAAGIVRTPSLRRVHQ